MHKQHSLVLLHKIRSTGEPQALASQLQANSELRDRNLRSDADLALPSGRINGDAGKRRFMYRVVQDYNRLPDDTRAMTIPAFSDAIGDVLDVLDTLQA